MIIYHKYGHFNEIDEEFKDGLEDLLSDHFPTFTHFENTFVTKSQIEIFLFFHSSSNQPIGISLCSHEEREYSAFKFISLLSKIENEKILEWRSLSNLLPSYYFHPAHEQECLKILMEIIHERKNNEHKIKLKKNHSSQFFENSKFNNFQKEKSQPSFFLKHYSSFKEFRQNLDQSAEKKISGELTNFLQNLQGKILIQTNFNALFTHLNNGELQANALSQLNDVAELIRPNNIHYIGIFVHEQLVAIFNIFEMNKQTLSYSFCELNNTLDLSEDFYFTVLTKYFYDQKTYNKIAYNREVFPSIYLGPMKKYIQFNTFIQAVLNPSKNNSATIEENL